MRLKDIDIRGLYGSHSLKTSFHPDVNIFSGINGSFKSTMLGIIRDLIEPKETPISIISEARVSLTDGYNLYFRHFNDSMLSLKKQKEDELLAVLRTQIKHDFDGLDDKTLSRRILDASIQAFKKDGVNITPQEFEQECHMSYICTFDRAQPNADNDESLLDEMLAKLESEYAYFLSDKAKIVTDEIQNKGNVELERLNDIYQSNQTFLDIISSSFATSGKSIDVNQSKLRFNLPDNRSVTVRGLSSGEKQLLIIMLTVLLQNGQETILLMDEPEISLHFEWQLNLIDNIRKLNPNAQIIITSHSPAIIMKGWDEYVLKMDKVTHNG